MKLDFIPLDKLSVARANMRFAKKPPDVSDILPTVRTRGILQPLIVRAAEGERFEILGGARRFHAARLVAEERRAANDTDPLDPDPVPCAILDIGDEAEAIEASLIENLARLDPDEVTQWETFTRLVREGRSVAELSATFGLPDLTIRRVLALGNLLPRIRDLYRREAIDAATVRQLTLASKAQQKDWLALHDDKAAWCPTGHQLKGWLFGGASIPVAAALFDVAASGLSIVADLFGEDRYFADSAAFWTAQETAVAARKAGYLEAGWPEVVLLGPAEPFHAWEYEKTPKRKGGRVYIDLSPRGDVTFHEGYLTRKEALKAAGCAGGSGPGGDLGAPAKPPRPEVTSALGRYIDLHRHAAVRAALLDLPGLALRLLVAHAVAGSPLWNVRVEPQSAPGDAVQESVETCRGETVFDAERRAVLGLLGFDSEDPTVIGGSPADGIGGRQADRLAGVFLRLRSLDDAAVLRVAAVVIGESLAAGSAAVEAVGAGIGIDIAAWWQPDDALFDVIRDKQVLGAMLAEVAGKSVADANARETGPTMKRILRDCLDGTNGRAKLEHWVPKWMAFPPAAYTDRGGIGSVAAHAQVDAETPESEVLPAPTSAARDAEPGQAPAPARRVPSVCDTEPEPAPEHEADAARVTPDGATRSPETVSLAA